jgi:predicted transcriptional regulator
MTITVRLNPEVMQRLQEVASRSGLTVPQYVERLAEEAVVSVPAPLDSSSEKWESRWRAWASSHRALPSTVDDDREGIYAGRGE